MLRPSDIHEADPNLLEFPLSFLSFLDRVDIKPEAEKEGAFHILPLNSLRADKRGNSQDISNCWGSKLHGGELAALTTKDNQGKL